MKIRIYLSLFFVAILSSPVFANDSFCKVFVANNEFDHAGVSIQLSFDKIFRNKNYIKAENIEDADFILNIKGEELLKKYFYHAYATISLAKIENGNLIDKFASTFHKRCYTQHCSISDFKSTFAYAYSQFMKTGPDCAELNYLLLN